MSLVEQIKEVLDITVLEEIDNQSKRPLGIVLVVDGELHFLTVVSFNRKMNVRELVKEFSKTFTVAVIGHYAVYRYTTPHNKDGGTKHRCWLLSMEKMSFYFASKAIATIDGNLPQIHDLTCKTNGVMRSNNGGIKYSTQLKNMIKESISFGGFEAYL